MHCEDTFKIECRRFLAVASEYRLGELPSENAHPDSKELSSQALHDLPGALRILKEIDAAAMRVLLRRQQEIESLAASIGETIRAGKRIFLCGCGATGRLSLTLETLWRAKNEGNALSDRIIGFMAGGDVALIKSIENFEDYPKFGAEQLVEVGFEDGDLLIGCTEGGETPFVIGATEKALEVSGRSPYFLYCNPDEILCRVAERSRRVIENQSIQKISFETGPMAITGSTRMQASTVLMAAVGASLFGYSAPAGSIFKWVRSLLSVWDHLDTSFLADFIIREADFYEKKEFLLYSTDGDYGITVLTDTTERAPTFSLLPFENRDDGKQDLSWSYLFYPEAECSRMAWESLLRRSPRTLDWPEITGVASEKRLLGFDFSRQLITRRMRESGGVPHHYFWIQRTDRGIRLRLEDLDWSVPSHNLGILGEHLLLKQLLNTHSTLVMGRLGRYQGNVMTWVRPSNNKLIDRTIRYVDLLLKKRGLVLRYDEIAFHCFEVMERLPEDQSIVLAVARSLLEKNGTEGRTV